MRKALFAVMLIGASFAGGAVVNGPGLRWAQEMILSHLNGDGDEEAKSKSDEPEPPAQLLSAPLSLEETLAAGRAGSSNGKTEPEAASQDGRPQTQPRPAGSESGPAEAKIAAAAAAALAAGRNEAANATATSAPAAKSEGSVASGALKMLGNAFGRKEEPPADDREIALAKVPTPLPEGTVPPPLEPLDPLPLPNEPGDAASRPAAKVDDPPAKDRDKRLALAAAPIAAAAAAAAAATAGGSPPPRTFEPIPAPEKGAAGAGADANSTPRPASSWTEIRSRMAKLGVSRYGVEGEPNGRVRFHCVIPLAGRRAVAQQFEAEGDDELQAAEIALRRVALWRATENPGP